MSRHKRETEAADEAATREALQKLLRASESSLDFTVTSRLAAARARAVAESGRPRTIDWLGGWRWGAPALLAAALVVGVLTHLNSRLMPAAPQQRAEMQAVNGDQIEMVGEDSDEMSVVVDLDFYQWLDETHAGA